MKTTATIALILGASTAMASLPPTDRTVFDNWRNPGMSTSYEEAGSGMAYQNSMDMQLNARVNEQLRASVERYDASNYTVSTNNGEVTITGRVRTQEEKDAILTNVRNLGGVASIKNQIIVDPSVR